MLWKGVLLGSVRKGSEEAPCVHFWDTGTARTFITQTINFHRLTTVLTPVHEANNAFFCKTASLCQSHRGACALPGWRGQWGAALPLCYGCVSSPSVPAASLQLSSVLKQTSVPCSFSSRRTLVLNLFVFFFLDKLNQPNFFFPFFPVFESVLCFAVVPCLRPTGPVQAMDAQYCSRRCWAFPCLWVQDTSRAPSIQRQNSAPALSIFLAHPCYL